MPKRLNGSSGTGKKIMQNQDFFNFSYRKSNSSNDKTFYTFDWTFGVQSGSAVILLNSDGTIDHSSTLNCTKNKSEFLKSLGAYNDPSLYDVFRMMLDTQNISHK